MRDERRSGNLSFRVRDHEPSDPRIGATIGHFRVLETLGRGGMGIVYRAEDVALLREVALKLLPPEVAGDPERRRRLIREARSAAAVSHANIATIYEVGEDALGTYLAMELVRGSDLREVLGAGLPRSRALAIGLGIARGLARAHESGVYHRDLKPENVMIDREGEPKILDFGLARAIRDEQRTSGPDLATIEGRVVGTPGYMSPEQARGAATDARSDVFTLGIVLFELLSGDRPFRGPTPMDAILAVLREKAPRLRGVDDALADLVARCLENDPARRYPDAGAVRDALAAIVPDRQLGAIDVRGAIESAPTMIAAASGTIGGSGPSIEPPSSSIVGRDDDARRVLDRFDAGARIVTLVGPGGIGKTRLSQHVAARLRDREGTRAIAVSLAGARSAADVESRVAGTLGVALGPGDRTSAIAGALAARGAVLLSIDEAESVVRELGPLLAAWLARAPAARALVTSRERLRAKAEDVVDLGPLDPDAGAALFLARAAEVRGGLTVDDAVRADARALAERLEGSPLAIELAAARVELLAPSAILARLDDRLKLLARRDADDPRHKSLRAVIEWSWSLLDEVERSALVQLAAFASGFEIEAAEGVIELGEDALVIDVVQSLRDKSLLRVAWADGVRARLAPYESVRLFAWQELARDPGLRAAALGRHARFFAERAVLAEERAREHGERDAERWLAREQGELLAIADRALEGVVPTDLAIRALGAVARSALARSEGEPVDERLAALLATDARAASTAAASTPVAIRAGALAGRAAIASTVRPNDAKRLAEEALALAREAGEPRTIGRAALVLARTALDASDLATLERASTEALAAGRAIGSADLVERALHLQAAHAWRVDRPARGLELVRDAIESAERRGARAQLVDLWLLEAILLSHLGDEAGSEERALRALELARAEGLSRAVGTLLSNLGSLAHLRGDVALARERLDEAIHVLDRRGLLLMAAVARGNLGVVEGEEGAPALARAHLDAAIATLEHMGEIRYRSVYLAARAGVIADEERSGRPAWEDAEPDIAAARALRVEEPAIAAIVDVCAARIDLSRARAATDPSDRDRHRAAAEERIARASSIAQRNDAVRVAIRLARNALARS